METTQLTHYKQSLQAYCTAHKCNAYLIIDPTIDASILPLFFKHKGERPYSLLYEDIYDLDILQSPIVTPLLLNASFPDNLIHQAHPYFKSSSPFFDAFYRSGKLQKAGMIILSPHAFEIVFAHIKSLIYSTNAQHVPVYFRFYDPTSLHVYIQDLTKDEIAKLLGPIHTLILPSHYMYWSAIAHPTTCERYEIATKPWWKIRYNDNIYALS